MIKWSSIVNYFFLFCDPLCLFLDLDLWSISSETRHLEWQKYRRLQMTSCLTERSWVCRIRYCFCLLMKSNDMTDVTEFIRETWEDVKSPTTSTFALRMSHCRDTIAYLEEVGCCLSCSWSSQSTVGHALLSVHFKSVTSIKRCAMTTG